MVAHKLCETKDLALTWVFDPQKKGRGEKEEEEKTEEEEKGRK